MWDVSVSSVHPPPRQAQLPLRPAQVSGLACLRTKRKLRAQCGADAVSRVSFTRGVTCPTLVDFRLILYWKHAPPQAHLVLDDSKGTFGGAGEVE